MKKILLSSVALFGIAGTAVAADLPARMPVKAPPIMAPVFSWTGCYIGGNAGWVRQTQSDITLVGTDTGNGGLGAELADRTVPSALGVRFDGFLAGGQVGCNWQTGAFVFGVEGDLDWSNADDSLTITSTNPLRVPITTSAFTKLDWLGTARARLGVAVAPQVLLYVTGGLAIGETELGISSTCPTCGPPRFSAATSKGTSAGWTAGGGIEWAFDNNWSVKGEYLYFDLGTNSSTISYAYGANTSSMTASTEDRGHLVRAGVNYRFGGR